MEGRNFILGWSLQCVRARARAAIHPTCSRRGSPPRTSPRLPSAAASSPPTSHRPDDLQEKKKSNNLEVDENKARDEGSVRFGSARNSEKKFLWNRVYANVEHFCRPAALVRNIAHVPAARRTEHYRCACVRVRVCENSSKLCVCGKERGRENGGQGESESAPLLPVKDDDSPSEKRTAGDSPLRPGVTFLSSPPFSLPLPPAARVCVCEREVIGTCGCAAG